MRGRIVLGSGSNTRDIAQLVDPFKRPLHQSLGVAVDFYRQSDPTENANFRKFWGHRDPFFRNEPEALDRRADVELTAGRHGVAERLSQRADELRRVGR